MTFTVNQEHLSDAIRILKRHIDNRPSHPILAGYLLELEGNYLKMTAVGERGFKGAFSRVTLNIPATRRYEVDGEVGEMVVPFRWFGDVVEGLPKGCAISLSMKEVADPLDKVKVSYSLELQTVTMSSSTEGMDPNDFPVICDPDRVVSESMKMVKVSDATSISIPSQIMASVLKESLIAVSKDPYKEVLNGINLSLSDGNLQVAGTDGHRLVHAIYSYPGNSGQVTIPLKVAESLSKLLGTNLKKLAQGNSTVVISQDYNRVWEISYEVNGAKVTYAFEEHSGTYPNYTQLFPNSFLSTVVFSGKDLKDSLSRIEKTVKRATISSVRFQFDSAIGKVAITADSHREEIAFDGDIDRGFSGKIAFNVYYLLDALKSDCFAIKDNGRVTLSFNSPTTPAILAPDFANSLNPATPVNSYRYLIMPVQIRDF